MKTRFDTYKMANWLLGEAMDPNDPMNDTDEELDLEDSDNSDEESEDEESEDEEELEDEELDDLDDDDLDDDSEEESEDEELENLEDEVETDDMDISDRLASIEDKLDTLVDDKPEDDEEFDLDLSNPVCPCCGARLNILNTIADTEDIAVDDEDDSELEDTNIDGLGDLLDGEMPETEGEEITTMDDDMDSYEELGFNDDEYVSLDDEDEDEE